MGEVNVQIRKRKKLMDHIRSTSDVWKRSKCVGFGVRSWELREERWDQLTQQE